MNEQELAVVKAMLKKKRVRRVAPETKQYLSTGVALLNLAISGRHDGGILKGDYVYFVGNRSSGKTFFSLNVLAEASINPEFADYQLIGDFAENGALMDIQKFWGPELARRLAPPRGTREKPIYSRTTEDFYFHLDDALSKGPCIYVMDSMDALTTDDDQEKFQGDKVASRAGKEMKGSYGMSQAKINSRYIKPFATRLRETGSILIVISQTRDRINTPFPMSTHSGGKSLGFYAHVEIWTKISEEVKKTVRGKQRKLYSVIELSVEKNRQNGWDDFKVYVPHSRKFGLDDLGASVDFLIDEKHWKKKKKDNQQEEEEETDDKKKKTGKFIAPEFDIEGDREKIIERIQAEGGEKELHQLAEKVWKEIDEECSLNRVNKYSTALRRR